jgi:glucan biosynthesis protein C
MHPKISIKRRYDLDWLRIFATLVVFLFHAAKPFMSDPWNIKNAQSDPILDFMAGLVDVWMMPLLFIVSGMSIALSLRSRPAGAFIQERTKRLLIPFLFGLFFLAPLQVYIERLNYGQFHGSIFQFLPQAFDGLYLGYGGTGNFAWMGIHLWYLGVLLIYSLVLLPLFLRLSHRTWRARLGRLGVRLESPILLILAAVPLMLLSTLDPSGLGFREFGKWNLPVYFALLIYGFLTIQALQGYEVLFRRRWLFLLVGLAAGLVAAPLDAATYGTLDFFIGRAARGLVMWCFLLFLLGLFQPLRQSNSRLLRHTSEMVLPFYILHQPVIIVVGHYLVLPLNYSPLVKYALLVVISLPIVIVIYEFLVRRFNLLRILHGLKPLPSNSRQVVSEEVQQRPARSGRFPGKLFR